LELTYFIKALRKNKGGGRSQDPGGQEVVPLDVAADLLFLMWKMEPEKGDRALIIMEVVVHGFKGRDEVTPFVTTA